MEMLESGGGKVLNWASHVEDNTLEQALRSARMPFVRGHVALMPDAHWGLGATVGSVIPTEGAIMPAAVGVDIGCGMVAVETALTASDLPDDLGPLLSRIERAIPAGVGKGHEHEYAGAHYIDVQPYKPDLLRDPKISDTACSQFGTLGSGNHFFEVCLDERDQVWIVLHSGSRGVGNQLAKRHIESAKGLMKRYFVTLEDPDLAYFVQGTDEFDAYLRDLMWAQEYAFGNRDRMMDAAVSEVMDFLGLVEGGVPIERQRINCHHNYTAQEHHHGRNMWITRKGAILAREGTLGVIPGSMGTRSYIVAGKGNPASYHSCSHGAGRRMSRGEARRQFTVADLTERMGDRTWLADKADALIDEIPDSYKDIDRVMADQADLVTVRHELRQILNYKGT